MITSYEHWLSVCPKLAELRACYGRLHADLTAKINEYEDILVRLGRVSRDAPKSAQRMALRQQRVHIEAVIDATRSAVKKVRGDLLAELDKALEVPTP